MAWMRSGVRAPSGPPAYPDVYGMNQGGTTEEPFVPMRMKGFFHWHNKFVCCGYLLLFLVYAIRRSNRVRRLL